MITADQLVAHLVGDYLVQSDWMANEKTKRWAPAAVHAFVYSLCFTPIVVFKVTEGVDAKMAIAVLAFILVTHFIIDRWRLARYVVWAKNFLSPPSTPNVGVPTQVPRGAVIIDGKTVDYDEHEIISDADGMLRFTGGIIVGETRSTWWHPWAECVGTGYHKDRPPWMTVWLMIIADNTMHILLNGIALWVMENSW